ncbi:MAG: hypothetical protein WDZ35_16420 [Crocinitomicaceae bacterium]
MHKNYIFFLILTFASVMSYSQVRKTVVFKLDSGIDRPPNITEYKEAKMVVKIYQRKHRMLIKSKFSELPPDKNWYTFGKVEQTESGGTKYYMKDSDGNDLYFVITDTGEFREFLDEDMYVSYTGRGLKIKYL